MAALNNKIYIGSLTNPSFYFENDGIMEIKFDKCVDVISEELAIDVLKPTVKHIATQSANLRFLPYGTPVWWYIGNDLKAKFYSESVERDEQNYYVINCISAIGILDKQYYHGGIYNGETCGDILGELIDDAVPFTVSQEVADTKLYGYLPYGTKRECLHEIIYAEGISILKDANGDMFFTYAEVPSTPDTIPQDRIFLKGKIKYPAIPSKIELVEHSYQYIDTIERVTLFDNSDGNAVTGQAIYFDTAPIAPESLEASEGLTIGERNANFASLTGKGVLTGIPYYDKQNTVIRTFSGGQGFTKSITERTLVTAANSENVADRLLSYYTSVENMEADIKIDDESCGNVYSFINKYHENVTAFLSRIKGNVSSFIKGSCEFLAGFTPNNHGNVYGYEAGAAVGGWITVPEGVKKLRLLLVGGGDGGDSGLAGTNPWQDDIVDAGVGGAGGNAGNGGKIKEIVINNPPAGDWECFIGYGGTGGAECTSETVRNQGTEGTDSYVIDPNGVIYSTADTDAYRSVNGIKRLLDSTMVLGKKGYDGVKGGNGGRGGTYDDGSDGEDVVYKGVTYKGGKGGAAFKFKFHHVDQSYSAGGSGGSGAMAGHDGYDGNVPVLEIYQDRTSEFPAYEAYERGKVEPSEPARIPTFNTTQQQRYGDGGDGGNGGAGRGGWGAATAYTQESTNFSTQKGISVNMYVDEGYQYATWKSGNGTAGKNGKKGVCFFYADKEMLERAKQLEATVIRQIYLQSNHVVAIIFDQKYSPLTSRQYRIFYSYKANDEETWGEYRSADFDSEGTDPEGYYTSPVMKGISCKYRYYIVVNSDSVESTSSEPSNVVEIALNYLDIPVMSEPVLTPSNRTINLSFAVDENTESVPVTVYLASDTSKSINADLTVTDGIATGILNIPSTFGSITNGTSFLIVAGAENTGLFFNIPKIAHFFTYSNLTAQLDAVEIDSVNFSNGNYTIRLNAEENVEMCRVCFTNLRNGYAWEVNSSYSYFSTVDKSSIQDGDRIVINITGEGTGYRQSPESTYIFDYHANEGEQ